MSNMCFRIGFAHIGRVGSVFITISLSVERYLSIRHPTDTHSIKKFLIPLPIGLAIVYNLPKFFEFVTCHDTSLRPHVISLPHQNISDKIQAIQFANISSDIYQHKSNWKNATHPIFPIQDIVDEIYRNQKIETKYEDITQERYDCENEKYGVTPLRKNHWYIILYVFGSEVIFIEMLPWVTIIILNILTWRGIREFQRNRNRFIRSNTSGKAKQSVKSVLNIIYIAI